MADHVLHVTLDPDDPDGRDRNYSITCPHDSDDMSRQCVLWWECMNHPAGTVEQVDENGDGPCDEGQPGRAWHESIAGRLCHPTRGCFPARADDLAEAAEGLDLVPGTYPVDYEVEDFTGLSLHLITEKASA